MMLRGSHTRRIGGVFFHASLLGVIMLLMCQNVAKADEVPAFFLKIAKMKTLPRVGRSGKFEDFFYKAEKHIPRIGRNIQQNRSSLPLQDHTQQDTYFDLNKRRIDYPQKAEEWSWQNFPLAIEGPKELWRALAGYSRDGDDIENEIWQRKKRNGIGAVTTQAK
ncbi:ecdysis triggering hormone [Polyergus mexicanus]|uniref:ecdysis triggering hormone n=1 Tax=Polyergus mexicanus TaxID=615972 RepID=UPI0038B4BF4D